MMLVSATCRIVISYPIRNSTMTNGVVLDPFLGPALRLLLAVKRTASAGELNWTIRSWIRYDSVGATPNDVGAMKEVGGLLRQALERSRMVQGNVGKG